MSNPIKLAIDRQSQKLVSYQGSAAALPDLFQGNSRDFQITIVDPSTDVTTPYTAVDMNGFGLRMAVGGQPTGTAGGPTPVALQSTFVWSAANKYFTGTLDLSPSTVDALIGSAASVTAWFEINLTPGRATLLQVQFTLRAVVDELTSTSPAPADQYLTKAECLALFQKLVGDIGQRLVLKSANGTYGRELGVNDDGTAEDNIIVL